MKIETLLSRLSYQEKEDLYQRLELDLNSTENLSLVKTELNQDNPMQCPHCKSQDIYGHGTYKGRKRYMCVSCSKTFNDLTGTAISCIKKPDLFHQYTKMMVESISIRKAAKKLDVNVKTIFDWRHKILAALEKINGQQFDGIVECDDKQLDISEKGENDMKRKSYKRPSDRTTKRGVSNDKVSIVVATDRKGNLTMKIAKVGRIEAKSLEATLGSIISTDNVLCSDENPSIISWARGKGLEHHTFKASQHIKDKCYHVQHVNSIDNRYERWVKKFYGVATKYLGHYLNWFVFLDKTKKSKQQLNDLFRVLADNMETIKMYRTQDPIVQEIRLLQYSKT